MPYVTVAWGGCALIAVYFSWLGFPLTTALNAQQISYQQLSGFSLGMLFQLLIAIGIVSMLFRYFINALIFFSVAMLLLLYFPYYVGFVHSEWISNYVMQSRERLELHGFLQQYFVPNLSSEPTFTPVKKFESVFDQLAIIGNMLKFGWCLAVIANIALLMTLFKYFRFANALPIVMFVILSLAAFPVYRIGRGMLQVEKLQNQADQYFTQKQAALALSYSQQALQLNPLLAHSEPFLIKAANAYAISTNYQHPLGKISEAWVIIQQNRLLKNSAVKQQLYAQVRLLLQQASNSPTPKTELAFSLKEYSGQLIKRLWKFEALALIAQKNLHQATNRLQHSLNTESFLTSRFYLAYAYIQLHDPLPAIILLQSIIDQVSHSPIKADIYCTLGDAYTRAKQQLQARAAYQNCKKLDNIKNYRVIKALSGF